MRLETLFFTRAFGMSVQGLLANLAFVQFRYEFKFAMRFGCCSILDLSIARPDPPARAFRDAELMRASGYRTVCSNALFAVFHCFPE